MMQSTSVTLLLLLGLGAIQHAESAIAGWKLDDAEPKSTADATYAKTLDENSPITYTFEATGDTSVLLAMTTPASNTPPFSFAPAAAGATTTGVLTIAALDFETAPSHTVEITATDTATDDSTTTGVATLTITVTDLPAFTAPDSSPKAISVADGTAADTIIYNVTARTATGYTIDTTGNTGTDFNVHTNGSVYVANALARSRTASYGLVVRASDSASPVETSTVTLSITVSGGSSATRVSAFTSLMSVFLILPFLHIL